MAGEEKQNNFRLLKTKEQVLTQSKKAIRYSG
jgi:hypothetical protein